MSESLPEYNEYVNAVFENRLEDAKQHLIEAIKTAKERDALPVLAGIAGRFGSILLKQGDKFGAIAFYELSEELDRKSLLPKLEYAKFLLRELGDKNKSISKCKEIIAIASANPFLESDDDFSSDEYIEATQKVLDEANEI